MKHIRENHTCKICSRTLIIDIMSNGTQHQDVIAVTCEECQSMQK